MSKCNMEEFQRAITKLENLEKKVTRLEKILLPESVLSNEQLKNQRAKIIDNMDNELISVVAKAHMAKELRNIEALLSHK